MGEKRDAYLAELKTKLDEWNAQIDQLEAKAKHVVADSRATYQGQIDGLRAQRSKLEKSIAALRTASGGAWDDVKSGVENARLDLDAALKSALARLKSQ